MFHLLSTKTRETSADLLAFGHWFVLFNGLIAILCGTRYVVAMDSPDTFIGWVYLLSNGISHFIFLAFCLYLLTLFPLTLLLPSSKILRGAGAILATFGIATLWFDIQVFRSYGIHLSPLSFDLAFANISDVLRWHEFTLSVILLLVLELIAANWIWKRIHRLEPKKHGRKVVISLSVAFILTHAMHIWADVRDVGAILVQDKMFPLSYPATAKTFIARHGIAVDPNSKPPLSNKLTYPLEPLQCKEKEKQRSLLMIAVQGWNADFITLQTMPFFSQYQKESIDFSEHYSGGTRFDSGFFSMLYSLQGSYIDEIEHDQSIPVFQRILQGQKYQARLFSQSLQSVYPSQMFDGFKHYDSGLFDNSAEGDKAVVDSFIQWQNKERGTTASFNLLVLHAPADYEVPEGFVGIPSVRPKQRYNTAQKVLFNQYRQSLYALDQQLEKVLRHVDEDTIVILTGIYGQWFTSEEGDTKANFSKSVMHVPMVLHDTSLSVKEITYNTHHVGLMPTLLTEYFGCSTHIKQYSTGETLFHPHSRHWFYTGGQKDFAIYRASNITVVDPQGDYTIYNDQFKRLKNARLPAKEIIEVIKEGQRFY